MGISKKLKNSGFWQTVEVIALVICQFAYFAIMARLLEKEDFGLMAISNSFVALGSVFAEGGMGATLIQNKNVTHKHINAALQGGIFFGLSVFLLLFILSPFVAIFYGQPELTYLIRIIALNFLLISISSVLVNYLMMIILVQKIFNKSFVQIFFNPIKEGIYLTSILAILLILYNIVLNLWGEINLLTFLIFSSIFFCGTILLSIKRPHLFGRYINVTVNRILY